MSLKNRNWTDLSISINARKSNDEVSAHIPIVSVATRSDGFTFVLYRLSLKTYRIGAGCRGSQTIAWWKQHCKSYTAHPGYKRCVWAQEKKRETLAIIKLFETQIATKQL